jgi:hypothetical protein
MALVFLFVFFLLLHEVLFLSAQEEIGYTQRYPPQALGGGYHPQTLIFLFFHLKNKINNNYFYFFL